MLKSVILKIDFKEFCPTAYIDVDSLDISYRATKITEDTLKKEIPNESIVSFEKIRADHMLGIYRYLEYKLPIVQQDFDLVQDLPSCDSKKQLGRKKWFEKHINFFRQKLMYLERTSTFITPNHAFFCEHFEKIDYDKEEKK